MIGQERGCHVVGGARSDHSDNVDAMHREIAAALEPILRGFGYAIAGGNALRAYGLTSRPTRDLNLFSNQLGTVHKLAPDVEAALREAGYRAERIDTFSDITDEVPEYGNFEAEWTVVKGGKQVLVQLAIRDRQQPPVDLEIGPVLHVDDVIAGKVLAALTRLEARDVVDLWQIMRSAPETYTAAYLVALGQAAEPGYETSEFAALGRKIASNVDDAEFEEFGLGAEQIKDLRSKFRAWTTLS
jgi:Nucleotidyl transferase AbiEii toxin, Type IV TA system